MSGGRQYEQKHYEDQRRHNSRRNDDTRSTISGNPFSWLGDYSSKVSTQNKSTQNDFSCSETSGNNYRGDSHYRDRSPLIGNRRSETRGAYSDNRLCLYCGSGLLGEQESTESEGYHEMCVSYHKPRCAEATELFRVISKNKHVLSIAINVKFLYGTKEADQNKKKKREKRNTKVHEFVDKVSAIRNSNSGFLLIHLVGLNPGDNFTGAFDEFADVKLNELITDGSLFADVYKKRRLSDFPKPELKPFTDILVLCVEGAEALITSDFKTKLALDDCIVDVKEQNLLKFLQKRRSFKEKFYQFGAKHAEDLCDLQDSRHIQTKSFFQPELRNERERYTVLVDHIFDDLRLSEYISAFSKNNSGGSYLLGLAEEQIDKGYQTKILNVKPVKIDNCKEVHSRIRERISATCLVCDYDGKEEVSPDLVKIFFIPSRDRDGYVIHISVRSVSGIVFFDKDGPVAYRVNTDCPETTVIKRLTVAEWFKAVREYIEDTKTTGKD